MKWHKLEYDMLFGDINEGLRQELDRNNMEEAKCVKS